MAEKKIFGIEFSMDYQPGYQTRVLSLDNAIGERIKSSPIPRSGAPGSKQPLGIHVKSMQVPELMPSQKLRKQGRL